jgi:hypothetical protein
MSAAYATVLEKPLSPAQEKTRPRVFPESTELISAAFDVVIASSATEARRAASEYRYLCWALAKRGIQENSNSPLQFVNSG